METCYRRGGGGSLCKGGIRPRIGSARADWLNDWLNCHIPTDVASDVSVIMWGNEMAVWIRSPLEEDQDPVSVTTWLEDRSRGTCRVVQTSRAGSGSPSVPRPGLGDVAVRGWQLARVNGVVTFHGNSDGIESPWRYRVEGGQQFCGRSLWQTRRELGRNKKPLLEWPVSLPYLKKNPRFFFWRHL